jgi:hypothetical protein
MRKDELAFSPDDPDAVDFRAVGRTTDKAESVLRDTLHSRKKDKKSGRVVENNPDAYGVKSIFSPADFEAVAQDLLMMNALRSVRAEKNSEHHSVSHRNCEQCLTPLFREHCDHPTGCQAQAETGVNRYRARRQYQTCQDGITGIFATACGSARTL